MPSTKSKSNHKPSSLRSVDRSVDSTTTNGTFKSPSKSNKMKMVVKKPRRSASSDSTDFPSVADLEGELTNFLIQESKSSGSSKDSKDGDDGTKSTTSRTTSSSEKEEKEKKKEKQKPKRQKAKRRGSLTNHNDWDWSGHNDNWMNIESNDTPSKKILSANAFPDFPDLQDGEHIQQLNDEEDHISPKPNYDTMPRKPTSSRRVSKKLEMQAMSNSLHGAPSNKSKVRRSSTVLRSSSHGSKHTATTAVSTLPPNSAAGSQHNQRNISSKSFMSSRHTRSKSRDESSKSIDSEGEFGCVSEEFELVPSPTPEKPKSIRRRSSKDSTPGKPSRSRSPTGTFRRRRSSHAHKPSSLRTRSLDKGGSNHSGCSMGTFDDPQKPPSSRRGRRRPPSMDGGGDTWGNSSFSQPVSPEDLEPSKPSSKSERGERRMARRSSLNNATTNTEGARSERTGRRSFRDRADAPKGRRRSSDGVIGRYSGHSCSGESNHKPSSYMSNTSRDSEVSSDLESMNVPMPDKIKLDRARGRRERIKDKPSRRSYNRNRSTSMERSSRSADEILIPDKLGDCLDRSSHHDSTLDKVALAILMAEDDDDLDDVIHDVVDSVPSEMFDTENMRLSMRW